MKTGPHCHSKFTYNFPFEPEAQIRPAIEAALDGVCMTEHRSVEASQPAMKIAIPLGFQVFKGAEISANCDHLLVSGLSDDTWNRWSCNHHPDLDQVIEFVHCLGGICVPALPFWGCPLGVCRGDEERFPNCPKQLRPPQPKQPSALSAG